MRDGAGGHDLDTFPLGRFGVGRAAEMEQLADDEASVAVDFVGDGLPGYDLVVSPDARRVGIATATRRDDASLGDDEGAWNLRPLTVVLFHHGRRNVVVGSTEPGQAGHANAVLDFDSSDFKWLPEAIWGHYVGSNERLCG